MLNKEEIERIKINLKNNTIEKQEDMKNIAEYIKHLESREQKLIEKLEEINTRNVELYNSPRQKEVDFSEWNLAQELLEILKKE